MQECLLFTLSQVFTVCGHFDDGHFDQCEVISHCVLICIPLIISDVEHIFIYVLAICMTSLEKCVLGPAINYFDWFVCLFFVIELNELFVLFWRVIHCCSHHLIIFSPILWVVFSFVMVSFAVKNLLSLTRFHLFIFVFIFFRRWLRKGIPVIYVKECSVYVFL